MLQDCRLVFYRATDLQVPKVQSGASSWSYMNLSILVLERRYEWITPEDRIRLLGSFHKSTLGQDGLLRRAIASTYQE